MQDQSAWAAGNLADDCFDCFSLLKAQGLIPALFTVLKVSSNKHDAINFYKYLFLTTC